MEIPADLIVQAAREAPHLQISKMGDLETVLKERVDWWLEEGGDELSDTNLRSGNGLIKFLLHLFSVFVLEHSSPLTDEVISFTKLLFLPTAEWEKARDKGKPPKPKLDVVCSTTLQDVIERRMKSYPTSLEVSVLPS